MAVTAITAIDDINVANGTEFSAITLPATVQASLSNGTTADYAVTWAAGTYDGNVAGTYALEGAITITGDVTNPSNKIATVNVVVAEAVGATVVTTVEVAAVSVEENKTATPIVTVKDQNGTVMTTGFTLSYAITAGTSTVATTGVVTAAAYSATAANNVNTLTVTATPTEGTAVTGTATVTVTTDTTKPTITSVTAVNTKTIVVNFSEKVTNGTTHANYTLYNCATGVSAVFEASSGTNAAKIQADAAYTDSAQTGVKLTITKVGNSATGAGTLTGYPMGGLSTGNYIMYVSGITDAATTANTILANSNTTFAGTLTPDANVPAIVSATYDSGLGELVIAFDKVPVAVSSANGSKYSITNSTTTTALTGTAGVVQNTTELKFTLTAAQKTAVGTLAADASVSIAAGGITDGSNANTDVVTNAITATNRPELSTAVYDEATNKITLTFNKAVKLTTFDRSKFTFQYVNGSTSTELGVATADMSVDTTGTTATSVVLGLTQTGIQAINAQRATTATYTVKMADSAVTDSSNIANATAGAVGQTLAMTFTKETVVPTITGVTYSTKDNKLTLTFSERMDTTVGAIANLVLKTKDAAGALAAIDATLTDGIATAGTWVTAGTSVSYVLTAGEAAAFEAALQYGRFLTVANGHGFRDINRNALADITTATAAITVTYNVDDAVTALTAEDHGTKLIYLTLTGSTPSDACATATYSVYESGNVNAVKTINGVQVLDLDNDTVKETIVIKLTDALTTGAAASYYTVAYSGLTTLGGVAITNGTVAVSAGNVIAADSTTPALLAAQLTDVDASLSVTQNDTILLTFDEPIVVPATGTLTQTELGTGNTVAQGTAWNQLVITLGASPTFVLDTTIAGGTGTALTNAADANQIKDVSAVAWTVVGTADSVLYPTGAAAPTQTGNITIADVDVNGVLSVGDTITVPFNSTLKTGLTLDTSKITVLNGTGGALNAATTFSATVSGSNLILTFTAVNSADALPTSASQTVAITGASSNIKSSWGLETGNLTAKAVTLNTTNAPTISSAAYNSNTHQLKVVFSEAVNLTAFGGTDPTTVFSVTTGYSLGALSSASVGTGFWLDTADTTNKTVVFVLDGSEVIDAGMVYLNAKAGGATGVGIKDFESNKPKRLDTTGVLIAVSATASDTTAPTFTVAATSVDNGGDTIALTFSEAMDTATLTQAKVRAGGVITVRYDNDGAGTAEATITVANATASWNSAKTLFTITLDEITDAAVIPNSKYVTVEPAASSVRDLAGNATATTKIATAAAITAETTAPTFTVAANSVNAAGDTIVLTFSEVVKASTLDQAGVRDASDIATIKYQTTATTGGTAITMTNATAAFDATGKIFTITLNEATDGAFIPDNKFIEVIMANAAVTDAAGNAVAVTPVYTTTAVAKEATAPTVAWSTTGNANAVIAAAETLVLTFSEAMTATTITNANIQTVLVPSAHTHLDGDGAIGSAAWSVGNTVLTITYSAGTSAPTITTADTITATGFTDLAGNALTTVNPYTVVATDF